MKYSTLLSGITLLFVFIISCDSGVPSDPGETDDPTQPPVEPPAAPALSAPEDGTAGVPTDVILEWNEPDLAEFYHVQTATDEDFTELVADEEELTSTSHQISGLDFESTYHWRVRASNEGGDSDWSEVWTFITTEAEDPEAQFAIYDDELDDPWIDTSWNASINYDNPEQAYSGSYSILVDQDAWGSLSVHHGSWGSAIDIDPNEYNQLEVAIYPEEESVDFYMQLGNNDEDIFPRIQLETLEPGAWNVISVSVNDLNPNGHDVIHQINLKERSGQPITYYVDDWRLTSNGENGSMALN